MDCGYFIISKDRASAISDKDANRVYVPLPAGRVYLLPTTNFQYYVDNGLFEGWLIDWCRQLCDPGRTFLDIGAHTGTYAVSLADSAARVVAFEPQRNTYYALCGSVALSNLANVECVNVALGAPDQVGHTTLSICSKDGGGSSMCLPPETPVLREEQVEVRTLDSYNIANIAFIKMDVEGNELAVLKGATETIARSGHPKILFESNGGHDPDLFGYITGTLGYEKIVPISGMGNMFLAE